MLKARRYANGGASHRRPVKTQNHLDARDIGRVPSLEALQMTDSCTRILQFMSTSPMSHHMPTSEVFLPLARKVEICLEQSKKNVPGTAELRWITGVDVPWKLERKLHRPATANAPYTGVQG